MKEVVKVTATCPRWAERKPDGTRRCAYTRELPEYVHMQRAGHALLPGF